MRFLFIFAKLSCVLFLTTNSTNTGSLAYEAALFERFVSKLSIISKLLSLSAGTELIRYCPPVIKDDLRKFFMITCYELFFFVTHIKFIMNTPFESEIKPVKQLNWYRYLVWKPRSTRKIGNDNFVKQLNCLIFTCHKKKSC